MSQVFNMDAGMCAYLYFYACTEECDRIYAWDVAIFNMVDGGDLLHTYRKNEMLQSFGDVVPIEWQLATQQWWTILSLFQIWNIFGFHLKITWKQFVFLYLPKERLRTEFDNSLGNLMEWYVLVYRFMVLVTFVLKMWSTPHLNWAQMHAHNKHTQGG